MEMKKISLAVIVVAALLSVVLAADLPKDPIAAAAGAAAAPKASATAPSGSAATTTSSATSPTASSATGASAPAPSGAASTMPFVGSLAGTFLMAFFGYYLR